MSLNLRSINLREYPDDQTREVAQASLQGMYESPSGPFKCVHTLRDVRIVNGRFRSQWHTMQHTEWWRLYGAYRKRLVAYNKADWLCKTCERYFNRSPIFVAYFVARDWLVNEMRLVWSTLTSLAHVGHA